MLKKTINSRIFSILFLGITLCFVKTCDAQIISFLGKKKSSIWEFMKMENQTFTKEKNLKWYKYSYDEKHFTDSLGNDLIYLERNFISFKTPYKNFTERYYINEKDYCDSIIINENACLDCCLLEEDSTLHFFGLGSWKKLAENLFKSNEIFPILSNVKKPKDNKYAFIMLQRNKEPLNGSCRVWTATFEGQLDYKANKKIISGRVDLWRELLIEPIEITLLSLLLGALISLFS